MSAPPKYPWREVLDEARDRARILAVELGDPPPGWILIALQLMTLEVLTSLLAVELERYAAGVELARSVKGGGLWKPGKQQ
jgi:hypothetical protein